MERADHIHARVGHTQGSQVPDPRAPEWKDNLDRHISWWDQIIEKNKKRGLEEFTISPEFGPYPYMLPMPLTQQPITSQWDVNLFMKELLKERYS